jgi:hypothetical protein
MPTKALTQEEMQQALDLVEMHGSGRMAHRALGSQGLPPERTIDHRASKARLAGLKPTVRKDAPRIYEKKRLGKMHMILPDGQCKPGVRDDHWEWAGNYAAEKRPDVIVNLGDMWDMPSLSSYDKGKLAFEGRRYTADVDAGKAAMAKFLKPIEDYNRTVTEKYQPRLVFTLGNHEHRIIRYVDNNPEFSGKFSFDDLGIHEFGWEVHDFLKPVEIGGILYCHYFTSGVMGRPVSSAAALLRERQQSCTMGHVQYTDMAIHKKTQNIALFGGIFYQHNEAYLGYQGNTTRRQIIIKHEVENGQYDPMFVSLKFLEKNYS